MGLSFKRKGFTVNESIAEKFPGSAKVGVVAIALAVGLGIPAGIVSALKRNTIVDRVIMFITTLGIAMPSFIVATLLLYLFGVNLGWVKTVGIQGFYSYILPAFSLAFYPMSYISRLMRSHMLDAPG